MKIETKFETSETESGGLAQHLERLTIKHGRMEKLFEQYDRETKEFKRLAENVTYLPIRKDVPTERVGGIKIN